MVVSWAGGMIPGEAASVMWTMDLLDHQRDPGGIVKLVYGSDPKGNRNGKL